MSRQVSESNLKAHRIADEVTSREGEDRLYRGLLLEFDKMLAFWQQALRYVPRDPPKGGFVILCDPAGRGPNLSLDQVPEKRTGKRSRLHLDLYTTDQEGEVERLVKLGASRYPWRYRPGGDFVVLEDPDGNLFCVVQVTDAKTTP